jgi:hypothetical protein
MTELIVCPICEDQTADTQTNCSHYFCSDCINEWYKISKKCPYCRRFMNKFTKCHDVKSYIKIDITECPMHCGRMSNIQTNCGHLFCLDCITEWQKKDNLCCPLCRTKINPICQIK